MKTTIKTAEAIVGKVCEFTTQELTQMAKVCNKVVSVLESHKTPSQAKREYLTDDDLYRIEAILMCILESESDLGATDFDRYEAHMRELRTKGADNDIDKR